DYQGSRENLHLVERWTRTGPTSLEYVVTLEDPTVWTRPWTVTQVFTEQSGEQNRIYYEPRCNEGNYALPGFLHGARMADVALGEGRGADRATTENAPSISGAEGDPLQWDRREAAVPGLHVTLAQDGGGLGGGSESLERLRRLRLLGPDD